MSRKPLIIIVEDDPDWLELLSRKIKKHLDVEIEKFPSFDHAERRLEDDPGNFQLLVVDIFSGNSVDPRGLKFANFVRAVANVPVVIITGHKSYVATAAHHYDFPYVFFKGELEFMDLITTIRKIIGPGHGNDKDKPQGGGFIS